MAVQTSIHLLLFHVFFLEHIGRPTQKSLVDIAANYDLLYGRPNNEMKDKFLWGVSEIKKITTWAYATHNKT